MTLALAAILLLQTLHGPHAVTVASDSGQIELSTQTGTYGLDLGGDCAMMMPGMVVEVLAGSGGVATLWPIGADSVCSVFINSKVDDVPCAVNADGACDLVPTE